jgi:hypothetical protein
LLPYASFAKMLPMKKYKILLLLFFLSLTASGQYIYTYAGDGTSAYGGDGGAATAAQLYGPVGIGYDAAGNLYATEYYGHRIRKVSPAGIITSVAGNGTPGYSGDGGAATAAQLNSPMAAITDAVGNLYISDYVNCRIRKIDAAGIISTIAGNGTPGFSGDGAQATAAQLNNPRGIVFDRSGNIFIADFNNHRIRKISTSGVITTVAGTGTGGFTLDGVAATTAQLQYPTGVAIDTGGNLIIADYINNRIRKVDAAGIISTLAGTGSAAYSGDGGAAALAALHKPRTIAIDSSNNIYIADQDNHRIRKIDGTGNISTIAGTGTSGYGGEGVLATASQISYPSGLCLGVGGELYFTDGDRVRLLSCLRPVAGAITGMDSVCIGDSVLLTNAVSGGVWSATVGHLSVSAGGYVAGLTTGVDTVVYTITNTCASASVSKVVTVYDCTTGVADLMQLGSGVSLFPNPAKDNVFLRSTTQIGNVSIVDMPGREVYTGTFHSNEVTISLARFPSGIYFLKVDGGRAYKVLKE